MNTTSLRDVAMVLLAVVGGLVVLAGLLVVVWAELRSQARRAAPQ